MRSWTFTLVKPIPTGVEHGPFSATPCFFTASTVASGSGTSLPFSIAATPAWCTSHVIGASTASKTRFTAAVISGPIPSPGIKTAVC